VLSKTAAASLRRQGLAGISPRRFGPATTLVYLAAATPKHLMERHFDLLQFCCATSMALCCVAEEVVGEVGDLASSRVQREVARARR
jgi:hypothetical protein